MSPVDRVLKVQVSQASSDGVRSVLVYDRTRETYAVIREDRDLVAGIELLLDGRPKGFFMGQIGQDGRLSLGASVADPGW